MAKHIRIEITTKDGNKGYVTADPAMSEKTYNALMKVIDAAHKYIEEQPVTGTRIYINGQERYVDFDELHFTQVVFWAGFSILAEPTVIYTRGHADKPNGSLLPDQAVKVKEDMAFDVAFTNSA